MGLRSEDPNDNRSSFSNDVLVIEICGPNEEHFSVIDIPGIFKFSDPPRTTDADQKLIKSMVDDYIKNPRSIILAVMPATPDVATLEILQIATKVDPDGDRTLAILTKPDLVDKGAEGTIVDLVNGKVEIRNLNWHVVRNLSQIHLNKPEVDRGALEKKFFRDCEPWSNIDKERVGIVSLRERLQEMLTEKIRQEFPKVGGNQRCT